MPKWTGYWMIIKRGDVVLADFDPVQGSEQGKRRPALVIQSDFGNASSPTTIVALFTSQTKKEYPFTVFVRTGEGGLTKDSLLLLNHIRTVSIQHRFVKKLGFLTEATMQKVDAALKASLGLD